MQKTVLITGATSGIGKAAAVALSRQGFHVIIHGRDAAKTEVVRQDIITESGNTQVSAITADLFSMQDIREMCTRIHEQFPRIDILINNAGSLMSNVREVSADGIEKTFAVNVTAPFLITHLLLDLLEKSDDARIINVASNSHQLNAQPDFNDLELKNGYNPLRAYGNAKLFLIWNTQHLAWRTNVKVYSLHPGAVATSFGKNSNLGPLLNIISKMVRPFFLSPESGADTIVFLATASTVPGNSGDYYVNRKPAKKSVKYFSPEREDLIWNYCLHQTGIITY
ncbi:SDR family NAD(P)-dependent oxidoreductase [Chitinophaga sp.]|uniref:SDR family NAD(P)-dependent oxidoreductase n=1 Tax=Chitinophaga sp. TaxID=1869181 RepID=UPI0031DF957F